jgi:hypothetical protein
MNFLVQQHVAVPMQSVRWYFSGGLSVAILCLALLGWMHKNLDAPGSSYISSDIRLSARVVYVSHIRRIARSHLDILNRCSIIFALLPLSSALKHPSSNLAVHVGILAALVIIDVFGKIGTMPNMQALSGFIIVPQGREGETEDEARAVERASRDMTDVEVGGHDILSQGVPQCSSIQHIVNIILRRCRGHPGRRADANIEKAEIGNLLLLVFKLLLLAYRVVIITFGSTSGLYSMYCADHNMYRASYDEGPPLLKLTI